ncbi:MAG: D-alanyl-D-alanine carboxypeptidase [Clostridia bacterium]|nr:D-alanyl-D-alanine carboxypeptidase [Clostridia bacterium]
MTVCAQTVTVSSECDISDLEVPLSDTVTTSAIGTTLEIKAKSAVLLEPNTGKILYEQNADEKLSPASITKIMSLLLVMEAMDKGAFDLETVVTASEHACSMGGSQIWLEPGEAMTVDDLLRATVIASANDACVALGELVAGSEEGFVALMNERAKELGMNSTSFKNCTGLDAEGHITSAMDVAIMSAELIKHELIKDYSTVWMDSLRDGKSELVNTNKLVRFYKGTTGLKTGTTSIAKYCLSATAEREGLSLVAVVMAGETSNDRFEGAKKLLDYGFANYSFTEIGAELKETETNVNSGEIKSVKVKADGKISLLMPKNAKNDITRTTEWQKNLTAPIKKGQTVGYVNIYNGDENIGRIPITAKEDIKKRDFLLSFEHILKGIFKI